MSMAMKYNCTEPEPRPGTKCSALDGALKRGLEEQPQLVSLPIPDLGFGWEPLTRVGQRVVRGQFQSNTGSDCELSTLPRPQPQPELSSL